MSVSATFDFDPAEHYAATRDVTRRSAARFARWGFVALALGLLAWNVVPHWGEAPPGTLFASALPWLVLAAFWLWYFPFQQRRAARRLPERDPGARGPQTRAVDAAGYHGSANGVSVKVPWHAITRGEETGRFFLFYYNKQSAYYIPKRALSAAQAADVRALMREHLGDRAAVTPD